MDSLDEDDVTAALLLMQQAVRHRSSHLEDLFEDENQDPEDSDPLGGKKRTKSALPWELLERYKGIDANVRANEELLSVAGPAWQDAAKHTSQRAGVSRTLPKFTTDKTLKSGDVVSEYKCPYAEVIAMNFGFGFLHSFVRRFCGRVSAEIQRMNLFYIKWETEGENAMVEHIKVIVAVIYFGFKVSCTFPTGIYLIIHLMVFALLCICVLW